VENVENRLKPAWLTHPFSTLACGKFVENVENFFTKKFSTGFYSTFHIFFVEK